MRIMKKKNKTRFGLIIITLFAIQCQCKSQLEWVTIDRDSFYISMPESPTIEKDTLFLENRGTFYVTNYTYVPPKKSNDSNKGYSISYTDYPPNFGIHSDSITLLQAYFDNGINNAVKSIQGKKLPGGKIISNKGYPGREYYVELRNGAALNTIRIYIVKNRVYVVSIITTPDKSSNRAHYKFFDSFKLK